MCRRVFASGEHTGHVRFGSRVAYRAHTSMPAPVEILSVRVIGSRANLEPSHYELIAVGNARLATSCIRVLVCGSLFRSRSPVAASYPRGALSFAGMSTSLLCPQVHGGELTIIPVRLPKQLKSGLHQIRHDLGNRAGGTSRRLFGGGLHVTRFGNKRLVQFLLRWKVCSPSYGTRRSEFGVRGDKCGPKSIMWGKPVRRSWL